MIADPWFYAAAIPAILLVGISKGGFGSGAGLFATPLMALTVPIPQAAAILLPILCIMDVAGLWAYRGRFSRENLRPLLAGGLLGSRIAAACGIGTVSAISGVAKMPAPLPKPPFEIPMSKIAGIAAT